MNKCLRLLSMVAVLGLLFSGFYSSNVSAQGTFTDMHPNMESYQSVMGLHENDIIHGFSDGTFRPYDQVTRGQAAKMVVRAINLDPGQEVPNPNFSDVPTDHEFYPYIAVLAYHGLMGGYGDGRFGIEDKLQRGQMAKLIAHAYNIERHPWKSGQFKDVDANAFYAPYLTGLIEKNIATGTSPTEFSPGKFVDRGQMAIFLYRAEQTRGKN
ncbi:S-layer homology domain-containing protein [Sporosarcina highlanderae]|uniref:S-layer homology domain-containing protein n=1 Tax=Sporosarcina highlanderae TaxID=3035916 RepID=A0ABT8JLD0_9BACL|nr:S-layer homology domain-containing protein [Sporosarcina highlanderae]MDN4605884.1 S-layer homology domain-containing protein [Sporosarcina highlanderae]